MKCLICNQEFDKRVSLCNHIFRKHNMTKKEYYDAYIKQQDEGICKLDGCNNETIFINLEVGYKECCCLEHTNLYRYGVKSNLNFEETKAKAQKNSHTKEAIEKQARTNFKRYGTKAPLQNELIMQKAKQTCLEKYGVDNPYKSEQVKKKSAKTKLDKYGSSTFNNREKAKETCIKKYGVEHQMLSKQVKSKQKQTCQDKYGVQCSLQSDEVKTKVKETCKQKYGSEYYFQSDSFKTKCQKTLLDRYGVVNPQQIESIKEKSRNTRYSHKTKFESEHNCTNIATLVSLYGQGWLTIKNECTVYIDKGYTYISNDDIEKIKQYSNTHTRSRIEDDVYNFTNSLVSAKHDDRSQIKPLELDVWVESKNVAIEVDGIYYHSINNGFDKNMHLSKTLACENLGIRLIHITDWEWENRQDICKSIISSALGIYETKIYARQCNVREVSQNDCDNFLNINHIQGKIKATYRLGLYYKNELVQLICLGKSRFKKNEIELLRMCTKLNTQVVGGFSKLIEHQPYNEFISYVDRSKFDGHGYAKLGFELVTTTGPSYKYYKDGVELNRIAAQKHKLPKLLGADFDPNETESQNMIRCGWFQVFDCGTIKLHYAKKTATY